MRCPICELIHPSMSRRSLVLREKTSMSALSHSKFRLVILFLLVAPLAYAAPPKGVTAVAIGAVNGLHLR